MFELGGVWPPKPNLDMLTGSAVGMFWIILDGEGRSHFLPYRRAIGRSDLSGNPDGITDIAAWRHLNEQSDLPEAVRNGLRTTRPKDWAAGRVSFDLHEWSFVVQASPEILAENDLKTQVEECFGFWLLKRRWI